MSNQQMAEIRALVEKARATRKIPRRFLDTWRDRKAIPQSSEQTLIEEARIIDDIINDLVKVLD